MLEGTIALFLVFLALWLRWRWKHTSMFIELGIPGPNPSLLFGNLIELYWKGPLKCQGEWIKKYGRVFGYFYGMRPVIIIGDPHTIKMVLIKDFNKFFDRVTPTPLRDPHAKMPNASVLSEKGQRWKVLRSILTPTFTTSKMKQMAPSVHFYIERLLAKIEEKAQEGKEFNIHDLYQRLTMEVISSTAFGVKLDLQSFESNPPVLTSAQLLFDLNYVSVLHFIGLSFPLLRPAAFYLQRFYQLLRNKGVPPQNKLLKGCEKVIKLRRSNPKLNGNDLLQLMLDAKIHVGQDSINNSQLIAGGAEAESSSPTNTGQETKEKDMRSLTDDEVKSSAFAMLLAGYETTSTALTFASQLLVHQPEIQDKIYEEVHEVLKQEKILNYNSVSHLQYLDMVFNESLRIYPPVINFVNRFANEEVRYGDFVIPKGMQIEIPVNAMHHDPEYWPDPETFDPERFSVKPNSDGITFLPFGGGPRNCLGMRFAQMEAKMALAHLLHKFKFVPGKHTEKNLTVTARFVTQTPTYGVWVKAVNRKAEAAM